MPTYGFNHSKNKKYNSQNPKILFNNHRNSGKITRVILEESVEKIIIKKKQKQPYSLPEVESRTQGSRPRTQKKIRGQGQGQPFRTLSRPRTGMLEAKAKDQGHKRKCSPKKRKKRSSQKFFKRSPPKNVFQKIFQALRKILTIQKIVLSSSRGQANFRELQASRPRPRT